MEFDLVFEGGGAKGLAFVGALQAFERHGHTVRRVIGTSAGSITALLVAAGYNADECMAAINERLPDGRSRFTSFLQVPVIDDNFQVNDGLRSWIMTEVDNPLVPNLIEPVIDRLIEGLLHKNVTRHLISLFEHGGWYIGDNLLAYLVEKLDLGGRNLSSSTLSEFYRRTGRDLSVVATDTTGREMLVLNRHTAPDCPTVWAVRMSMSCPLVWQEVIWRPEWGLYRGRDLSGHVVVDGGLLSNFPIRLFVSDEPEVQEIMGSGPTSANVVGLLLDDGLEVPGAEGTRKIASGAPSFLERADVLEVMALRLQGMAETLLGAHDKSVVDAHKYMVCRLPAKGYGTLEFELTSERMAPILKAGELAMEMHLQERLTMAEKS